MTCVLISEGGGSVGTETFGPRVGFSGSDRWKPKQTTDYGVPTNPKNTDRPLPEDTNRVSMKTFTCVLKRRVRDSQREALAP
ncbi:hypothetical protein N7541_010984 [Penicillium brevicompactum]|uniref:Uncharacterized protein n=1 Tax=Penicillium brevicompactum TaxID=5074 RepID=A0A9W9QR16_PENBR|nr:hypothetical protein N7452_005737 [Penicillium brevicompactum]KAJ5341860.1 hypothetical protein N7541_010984 [Penicillium brevicompactum]